MPVDRRAEAYATQFAPLFISRYIAAARAGRSDIIPDAIRGSIVSYVTGTVPQRAVDAEAWMKSALYDHRLRTGGDHPLPPDFGESASGGGSPVWTIIKGVLLVFLAIFTILLSLFSAANR